MIAFFFFFNDTATTEIYTLSLHDALPISCAPGRRRSPASLRGCFASQRYHRARWGRAAPCERPRGGRERDRKSTRLNSSHLVISYAVFCLKKKKKQQYATRRLDTHPRDRL